jgi:hypothetical protein
MTMTVTVPIAKSLPLFGLIIDHLTLSEAQAAVSSEATFFKHSATVLQPCV